MTKLADRIEGSLRGKRISSTHWLFLGYVFGASFLYCLHVGASDIHTGTSVVLTFISFGVYDILRAHEQENGDG